MNSGDAKILVYFSVFMEDKNIQKTRKLRGNFFNMFWISALLNVKLISVISTVFYIYRGLSLSEIFYTSIVWSLVNLLFELPSSYMADKWGRKKTILIGILFAVASSVVNYFAYGFGWMALSIILMAISFACLSGTDEALIYDTGKELGETRESLKSLGKYYSGQRVFKIFTPFIAALIANNLTNEHFFVLIHIDTFTTAVAVFIALRLVEPSHFMDLEKMEKGIFHDAVSFFKQDKDLIKAMFSKTMIFISTFIIWRIQQEYFLGLGLALIVIGAFWSFAQLLMFVGNRVVHKSNNLQDSEKMINNYNLTLVITQGLFTFAAFLSPIQLLLIAINTIFQSIEGMRWPVYSHFNNLKSFSYNRAITLSLGNFMKSILDIPLLFLASILVAYDTRLVFLLAFGLSSTTYFLTRLKVKASVASSLT